MSLIGGRGRCRNAAARASARALPRTVADRVEAGTIARSAVAASLAALVLIPFTGPTTATAAGRAPRAVVSPPRTRLISAGDSTLVYLDERIHETLAASRTSFLGKSGTVEGLSAGSGYPQLWLRDSTTAIVGAALSQPDSVLRSWLVEFLRHQRPSGQLWDWIARGDLDTLRKASPRAQALDGAPGLSADTNTSLSDQEPSAVLAAAEITRLSGDPRWLTTPVDGERIIHRLDRALQWSVDNRTDPSTGLVTAAFTADWGDIAVGRADQQSIYRDADSPVVASLYCSAMHAAAADALASMAADVGERAIAARWRTRAGDLRARVQGQLWNETAGFFTMHRPVTGSPPLPEVSARVLQDAGFRTEDVFALGGNAVSALHGIATDAQIARIGATADERRKTYQLHTIGGNVLPPFPKDFFGHEEMVHPFGYQNAGQWTWWAARLVQAEFERGQAERALAHLHGLAEQVSWAGGIYEWVDPLSRGRGSAHYAGAAGSLAGALYRGLLGVDLTAKALRIDLRAGTLPLDVDVVVPSVKRWASLRYAVTDNRALLSVSTNATGPCRVSVRIPALRTLSRATADGTFARFTLRTVGADTYADIACGRWTSEPKSLVLTFV